MEITRKKRKYSTFHVQFDTQHINARNRSIYILIFFIILLKIISRICGDI